MDKVLLVVDYQHDFVSLDGALSAGERALQIEDAICEKIITYNLENASVFFTLDTHLQDEWKDFSHPEAKVFPSHCIKDTMGHKLYGKVKDLSEKGHIIEKRAYCPDFTKEPLYTAVRKAKKIEVCGLVTDICVFQTVIGLYTFAVNQNMQKEILVDTKACASFNLEQEQFALQYMKDVSGAIII